MMRVEVLIVLVLSASGAVAQEAVYGSHQSPKEAAPGTRWGLLRPAAPRRIRKH
jgi:hypothetical protein